MQHRGTFHADFPHVGRGRIFDWVDVKKCPAAHFPFYRFNMSRMDAVINGFRCDAAQPRVMIDGNECCHVVCIVTTKVKNKINKTKNRRCSRDGTIRRPHDKTWKNGMDKYNTFQNITRRYFNRHK